MSYAFATEIFDGGKNTTDYLPAITPAAAAIIRAEIERANNRGKIKVTRWSLHSTNKYPTVKVGLWLSNGRFKLASCQQHRLHCSLFTEFQYPWIQRLVIGTPQEVKTVCNTAWNLDHINTDVALEIISVPHVSEEIDDLD